MAYDPYTWVSGEVIEAELLNHIEDGIADIAAITDQMSFTAITAGPTGNSTLTWGGTFNVPQVGRNNLGLVSTLTNRTLTMPANPNTTYTAGTGLTLSGTTFNHSNAIAAGNAGPTANQILTFGGTFTVPYVAYDAQGHVTSRTNRTMTMPTPPAGSVTPSHYTNATINQIGVTLTATTTIQDICDAMSNENYATIRVSTNFTALMAQMVTTLQNVLTIYKNAAGECTITDSVSSTTNTLIKREWICNYLAGTLTSWRLNTSNVYTGADTLQKGLSNTTSTLPQILAVMQNGDVMYIPVSTTSAIQADMPGQPTAYSYILEIVKITTNYAMLRATQYSATLSLNRQWTCYYNMQLAIGTNSWNETGPNKIFFFGWTDLGLTTAQAATATIETIINNLQNAQVAYIVTYSSQSPALLAQMPFPASGTYLLEVAKLSSASIIVRVTRTGNTQSSMEQWTCYLTTASQTPVWTPTGGLISINSSTLSLNTFTTPGRYRWDATNTTISNKPESGSPALLEVEFIGVNSNGASVYRQTCHVGDVSTSSGSYTIYVRMITSTTAGSVSSGQWRSITGALG